MNDENMAVLINVIGAVEAGGQIYGKRRYDAYTPPLTNSQEERTVTLGWAQNHGSNARRLVQMIYERDPATFRKIDSGGDIAAMLAKDREALRWNPTESQKKKLIALIDSDAGHACQDELFASHMRTFIADCEARYTSSIPAVMMYCEIRHLGGNDPVKRIFDRLNGKYDMDSIMASLVRDQRDTSNDNQVGDVKYWTRHLKCKEFIERYAVEETAGKKEETMTENQARELVLTIALAEEGYKEKASASNLDDKTANAGSGNYTKYGRDMHAIQPSNMDYPAAWCDCFVDWCMMRAFGAETARKVLCGDFDDYTVISAAHYQKAGRWTNTAAVGYQVFFRNSSGICHTGLVWKVAGGTVYTIEGNASDAVRRKEYPIVCSSIAGYGMPRYDLAANAAGSSGSAAANQYIVGSGTVNVKHFLVGAVDPQVKTIQRLLNALGFKDESGQALLVDGDLGTKTSYAIASFQKAAGMKPDNPGTVATLTWEKLINAK